MWEIKVRNNETHKLIEHDYIDDTYFALAMAYHYKKEYNCRVSMKRITVSDQKGDHYDKTTHNQ